MSHRAHQLLIALAIAAPLGFATAANDRHATPGRVCNAHTDSFPSSLGADGWAATDGPVTGGCGATPSRIFNVYNRSQLVDALYDGKRQGKGKGKSGLSNAPKIIYIHGTVDLNVDDHNNPLTEEDYMRMCNYTAHDTYYDPVLGQNGPGGFFGAYKAAYDPILWNRQSLEADNRPPNLTGPLEEARLCFQEKQAERVIVDVGSNTSIIGVGSDAKIINGNIRIGYINQTNPNDGQAYKSENVVIRNITFADSFDMFPSWDPKDSFSVTITNTNGCQREYDEATNSGPHRCPTIRGGRWNAEYDNISVMNAERVWIDHNTFTDAPRVDRLFPPVFGAPYNEATQKVQHHDGNVDVTLLGTKVTISNNVFMRHDKTNLLGGTDLANVVPGYGPGKIDVTFHHNYYEDTIQRMPRVRFGRVHVYNNYYNQNRNANAEYRLGDTWQDGTAGKMVTENNLIDIRNNNLTIPRIINYASTLANRTVCVNAGYTFAECGTYYYNQNTYVKMITPTTSSETLFDAFGALQTIVNSNVNNSPLLPLDPADPGTFWFPTRTYSYSLDPVGTAAERDALRFQILTNAGAGKL
jgi:pectate lyase